MERGKNGACAVFVVQSVLKKMSHPISTVRMLVFECDYLSFLENWFYFLSLTKA